MSEAQGNKPIMNEKSTKVVSIKAIARDTIREERESEEKEANSDMQMEVHEDIAAKSTGDSKRLSWVGKLFVH